MVQDDDQPSRKAQRRSDHVTLTAQATTDVEDDGCVVVGHRLRGDVVSQSELLTGLGQTDGSATLPGHITPGGLQLWQTACVLPIDLSLQDLMTVLKVADVMGADTSKWLDACSDKLLDRELYVPDVATFMLPALLQLPDHLLQAVVNNLFIRNSFKGSDDSEGDWDSTDTLFHLWNILPPALHVPLTAAAVIRMDGSMIMPDHMDAQTLNALLTTLHGMPIPHPGLLSLDLPDDQHTPTTLALLARAAAAHPSIHTLLLGDHHLDPASLRTFAGCLPPAALPALDSLKLFTLAHPGGCVALADCLRRLPGLRDFTASIAVRGTASLGQPAHSAYLQSVSSPATLPHLTRLSFLEDASRSSTPRDDRARQPLSNIHMFLPIVRTPSVRHISFETKACVVDFPRLASSLSAMTSLQEICIEGAPCDTYSGFEIPGAATKLPQLHRLTVSLDNCAATLLAAALIVPRAAQSLTHIHLSTSCTDTREGKQVEDYCAMLAMLGRCTALKKLGFLVLPTLQSADDVADCSVGLCSVLQQLPVLTSLDLQAVEGHPTDMCVLRAADLGSGLGALSALERLQLGRGAVMWRRQRGLHVSGRIVLEEPGALLDVLRCMPRLRVLGLGLEGLQQEQIVGVAQKLTGLKEVALHHTLLQGGHEGAAAIKQRLPHCRIRVF